ncbi:MAG: hypothetical protein KJO41_03295 [Bacteroidia bacterium]|nr:hypothetical protein [Bacteroidia bacterium]NND26845.1 hypothetical protein [Flavobacteriaceae bacterium]MBT8278002.1 hypothetical protein [Bacteroidia bacterium]NNK61257.1 hypothetical protein [Flavobacteriaceae bacterium]NNL32684.1 hypothetical protein [Flavobacteriaceae bacterium]
MIKKWFLFCTILGIGLTQAQENIDDLLAAGISDAKRFSTDYLMPATDGVAYGINNGWFNHGKTLNRLGFELSLSGNIGFIKDEKKSFILDVSEYENVRFPDDSPSKSVATALGHNDPEQTVIVTYDDPIFGDQEVELTLPTGIGSANVNLIPTAFLQASFAPFKGTEIKGRFFPKITTEDTKIGLYGIGVQQNFTGFLPAEKIWPVAISGLVAYTHLDASYDFTDSSLVDGEEQRVETQVNTFLAELIVSTKIKIINFYGALGYMTGTSNSDLLGTYRVTNGVIFSEEIIDPFSVKQKVSGLRTTLGARLKVGFFGFNVDYTLAEFDSASFGIHFSF